MNSISSVREGVMKTLSLAVYLSAIFLVCSCSSDTVAPDPHTPMGTPVSLTVFNGFFKGYTTLGTQHTGTQLRFGNMTGSVIFANMTAHRPPPSCSGSYTIVAVG